jgi:hypothetical protein
VVCTLVLVSQRTSSCCTRRDSFPAMLTPQHHGTQWQPGPTISTNFPHFSFTATVDWSTCTNPRHCPILTESQTPCISVAHQCQKKQPHNQQTNTNETRKRFNQPNKPTYNHHRFIISSTITNTKSEIQTRQMQNLLQTPKKNNHQKPCTRHVKDQHKPYSTSHQKKKLQTKP